ncbi:MAG: hypothetical protein JJE53_01990 [Candidatus Pacebacteria bacterium]|nr:hypothetical protein [Candidatus Paceibacterota bacterium]
MKVLFATTNQNKISRIRKLFKGTDLDLVSLNDLDYEIKEPEEIGKNGLENSIIKAEYYYKNLKIKMPVLAQDDTIFLSEVIEEDNPKKDIKLPVIKKFGEFTDENAYIHYSDLVTKYNKEYLDIKFIYGHAICSGEVLEGSESSISGRLYSEINSIRTPGYFLSDMFKLNINGFWKYYSNLNEEELIEQDNDIKRSIAGLLNKYN